MSAPNRTHPQQRGGVGPGEGRSRRYVAPAVLLVLLVTIVIVVATSLGGADHKASGTGSQSAPARKLPVYWRVKRGQTYAQIAEKTGLTVEQLEAFNPETDPNTLFPGARIKLRAHVPKPKPKPKGPRFYTVRSGQSYGSIAAKTHHSIVKLQKLNPKLKPSTLQAGDRVRLRP